VGRGRSVGERVGAWASSAAVAVAFALLAQLAACGSTRAYVPDPGVYDRIPAAWRESLSAARLAFERGDAHTAYTLVAPLALERPRLVSVRTFLQELELELLTREGRLGELVAASPAEARTALAQEYERAAETRPTAEDYVLAARLAAGGESALALLDEADEVDPRCVWVHYARAWWRFGLRRFKDARESLRAALRLDGGHLPSIRLHATLLAGAGEYEGAAGALEVWLERTADDPLYAAAERADALLDLAAAEVLRGRPKQALERLDELDPRAVRDPVRSEEVRASAYQARGELTRALEAVARAAEQRPDALLPLVQRALLLQAAGDVEGERKTWLRLLELTESLPAASANEDPAALDFDAALFRLQAHTRLERLARVAP
jgi:tetratricopeptide (TPR) repeat protein